MTDLRSDDPIEAMLSRLDRPVSPSSDFARTLRARVIAEAEAGRQTDGDHTTMQNMTALPAPSAGGRPERSTKWKTRRWMAGLEIAAAVLLLLATFAALGGTQPVRDRFAGLFPHQQDEQLAPLGPAAMYGGDAGRTGQQPGPAPEYEFVDSWKLPVEAVYKMGFAPVALGDTVYRAFVVAPNDDPDVFGPMVLQAVDVVTGSVRWQQELNVWGSPAVTAELVFVNVRPDPSENVEVPSHLLALDATTGQTVWSVETGASDGWIGDLSPLVIGENVYTAAPNGTVYAVEGRTGKSVWTSTEGASTETGDESGTGQSPLFAGSGLLAGGTGALYVVNSAVHVVALDLETGAKRWDIDVRERFQIEPQRVDPMVVKDILVLRIRGIDEVPSEKNTGGSVDVYATVEGATGENLWRRDFSEGTGDPAIANGLLIVPTLSAAGDEIVAVDLSSAQDVWTQPWMTGNPNGVSVSGDLILFSGGDKRLNVLDTRTMTTWYLPQEVSVEFPAVVTQQRVIIQDEHGTLLGYSTDQRGTPTAGETVENAEATASTDELHPTVVPAEPTATIVPLPTPTRVP
jgi:outer membrane protein assembly factor BamB